MTTIPHVGQAHEKCGGVILFGNFPFLDRDLPCGIFGLIISQLVRFARVCSYVFDLVTMPNFKHYTKFYYKITILFCQQLETINSICSITINILSMLYI